MIDIDIGIEEGFCMWLFFFGFYIVMFLFEWIVMDDNII